MGVAILGFLVGVAVALAAAWLLLAPSRRALRELLALSRSEQENDWRARTSLSRGTLGLLAPLGRLAGQMNATADANLRRLKDLARKHDDLVAIVDALPDPILQVDTRREVILLNAPAASLLEIDREAALSRAVEAVVPEPAVLALFDAVSTIGLDETGPGGEPALPVRRQMRFHRDGRPLAYQAVATRSGAGGVLVVLRDVSTLDATLRMKTDFVANAGHELRTPLAAIKAAYETLADNLADDNAPPIDPATGRCLSIMGGHLQRLEEMLRDLLDLSRAEAGHRPPSRERVSLGDVARDLRQSLSDLAAEKGVALTLLPDATAAGRVLVSDPRLLLLALKNLVENGIKYTPSGGSVELRHAATERGDRLTVRDTGMGISPEHVDRVFERFYQVEAARTGTNAHTNPRSSGRGTGLGLSIVKHAVGALGGTVAVESELGRGTTFTILLPRHDTSSA